jgi:hypothetical protein
MKCRVLPQVRLFKIHPSIVLYDFTNKEQDIVASCFRVGNYYTMRDLPDDLQANNVMQAMRERMEKA